MRLELKQFFLTTIFVLGISQLLDARPHVAGYERFHRDEPTVEGGAVLYSELGCANCHGGSAVVVPRMGPNLTDLSKRVQRSWVVEFLKSPEHGRNGSTMPSMFDHLPEKERDAAIDSVVAWLGSLNGKLNLKPARHANAERGSALYHEQGCVACHAPASDYRSATVTEPPAGISPMVVPLPNLNEKTSLTALTDFILNPSTYRTDGRMPHIVLDARDAADLAAHLMDYQASDPRLAKAIGKWPAASKDKIAKGHALAEQMNCASCHQLPGIDAMPIRELTGTPNDGKEGHCLSSKPKPGLPRFDLDENQKVAITKFLSSKKADADKTGKLTLTAMNCFACHDRDGIGGPTPETNPYFVGNQSLGDSGRLPPPLTGVGHKLKQDWMESVFKDGGKGRVRKYVKTQMPVYPKHAKALAEWLSVIDAKPGAKALVSKEEDVEAGRKLLGVIGGVNCITCHDWGERPSLGIRAMDLSSLDQRLRPEWFRTYLLDPASYRPGTLMPSLWPGGKSTVNDVLGGDTERQIGAIWQFIKSGEGIPSGFPDIAAGQFELTPDERPIIQRTFLEGVGTRAILVGFPEKIHLAYDGGKGRPASMWRGRFFDAYHTWFSRSAPFEKPLEREVHLFGESESETATRFLGYELDGKGNPTFLSRNGKQLVSDHYAATEGQLIRTIRWEGGDSIPSIAHPQGVVVETKEGTNMITIHYSWKK